MADNSKLSATQPYVAHHDETPGQVVDLAQRRAALDAKKELTPQDLIAALKIERQELDRVGKLAEDTRRDFDHAEKDDEKWRSANAFTNKKSIDLFNSGLFKTRVLGVVALLCAVIAVVLNWQSSSSISTAKSEAASAKSGLVEFKQEVEETHKKFATKTELAEVREQIKVVGLKVQRAEEQNLAVNTDQDMLIASVTDAVNNKATAGELVSVKTGLTRVSRRAGKTAAKTDKLEAQILELKSQLQALQPKTM